MKFPQKPLDRECKIFKAKLRQRFIDTVEKYKGVPYKRSCYEKHENEYYYPIYLDCCGLIRRVLLDLAYEFGFTIGPANQGYQVGASWQV